MLPYQAELLDSVQRVSTPAFDITFQSKQRARAIPKAFKTGGLGGGAPVTERGERYFRATTVLLNRIPEEKRWTKLLGYSAIDDSDFDNADTFLRYLATPLITCIEQAQKNFHSLPGLRARLAPVATKLRHMVSGAQGDGMTQDATVGQSLLDEIDRAIDRINKLLIGEKKCLNINRFNNENNPGKADRYNRHLSDKSLRSLSERVPYLHIMLADIYGFRKNLDGAIFILERAAHGNLRGNPLFAFRLEFLLKERLQEWNRRTDLFLSTLDSALDIDLQIIHQSEDALERAKQEKDKDQKKIRELNKIRAKHIFFRHILQNSYAYYAAKALLADDDAKRFISETRISQFASSNEKFALDDEGSRIYDLLRTMFPQAEGLGDSVKTLQSAYLDTRATVKVARAHQRAKNNPLLSAERILILQRDLDDAIVYFDKALDITKGLAEQERKDFATSFPTNGDSIEDTEELVRELLVNLKPALNYAREEIRANRDMAISFKDRLRK
jgi:hypothetical protein